MSTPEHAAAHRGGHKGEVESVTSAEFRRMEQDRASVKRVLELADTYASLGHPVTAALIYEAVAGTE